MGKICRHQLFPQTETAPFPRVALPRVALMLAIGCNRMSEKRYNKWGLAIGLNSACFNCFDLAKHGGRFLEKSTFFFSNIFFGMNPGKKCRMQKKTGRKLHKISNNTDVIIDLVSSQLAQRCGDIFVPRDTKLFSVGGGCGQQFFQQFSRPCAAIKF